MLYVYAISESSRPPQVTGLHDAPLRVVDAAGLSAIVSEHGDLRLEAGEDELWTHESVVEQAMGDGAVLPMRFGSSLSDEPAVAAALRTGQQGYRRALDRVRGAVELAVRAVLRLEAVSSEADGAVAADGAVTTRRPGTAYMLNRLDR